MRSLDYVQNFIVIIKNIKLTKLKITRQKFLYNFDRKCYNVIKVFGRNYFGYGDCDMDYTLKDFVLDELLGSLQQLTKPIDLSKINVSSASVQELPFDDFVNKDEIIITTALGYKDDPDYFHKLFEYALKSAAAAVLVCLRDDNAAGVPASAIAYADEIGLPVFLIPWHIRFADVIALVYKNVHKSESKEYSDTQAMLFNLFFRQADLRAAAEYIETSLSMPVEIQDAGGRTLAKSHSIGTTIEHYATSHDLSYVNVALELNQLTAGHFLYIPSDGDLAVNGELVRRYLVLPLTLWFYQRTIEDMSVSKIKNDFVWNLAHGEYGSLDDMYRQSIYLKFNLKRPYTCLNMLIKHTNDERAADKAADDFSLDMMKRTADAMNVIITEAASMHRAVMVAVSGLEFIIYLETANVNAEQHVTGFISQASAKIKTLFPGNTIYWGVSDISRDNQDYAALYNNAALALQYSYQSAEEPHVFLYKATKKQLILNALAATPELKRQSSEIFHKLLEYDSASDIGLMNTLIEYIRCNYNISETARRLHIHRQSLLYRINKIEDLTGMSLSSHDDLFILETFSRMYMSY